MGKDYLKHSQVFKPDRTEHGIINEKFRFKNNSSNKGNDFQSNVDVYKDDSDTKTIEGYDKRGWKSCDSDKEVFTRQKNDEQFISDDGRSKSTFGTLVGAFRKDDWQDSLHTLKHSLEIATGSKSDSDLKSEHTKHDISAIDASTLEYAENPSTEIDTRTFQKKDCPQQFSKNVTSWVDKCSWYKESEPVSDIVLCTCISKALMIVV